jgi:hypothetical protein
MTQGDFTQDNSIPTYEKFSEIHPPRVDEANGETANGLTGNFSGSLKQRTELSPKMSDFQVVDRRLFPVLKEGLEWLNNLMVGRVFPETVIPMKSIIEKHLLQEYPEMSLAEAMCIAEVAVGVPLDSEGRIDIARVFVKAGEIEEEKEDKKL